MDLLAGMETFVRDDWALPEVQLSAVYAGRPTARASSFVAFIEASLRACLAASCRRCADLTPPSPLSLQERGEEKEEKPAAEVRSEPPSPERERGVGG